MAKPVTVIAAALVAVPVAVISACSTNEQAGNPSSGTTTAPPGTERLTTQLRTADGRQVANATIDFANGYATVTVETVTGGILTPGFHGLHIHSVGKCDVDSVGPNGGAHGDFLSAGGHFQVAGHTGHPASGDLTSLEVRSDGSAKLVTTTNAFTAADLHGGQGTALMIHQDPDDFGNIPPRYQVNGAPGPDPETLATGDSGKRVACGVIAAPSSGTSVSTSTSTVTATVTSPAPSTGGSSSPPPSSVASTTPSTDTKTVTSPPVNTTAAPHG
ncbi:MAG: superoxide dismutase, Cu-Zn family [Mycobacterium sp.]|nr:superoxide dismutase, Cu-Zn family [Mycobacterium sp.]